MYLRMGAVGIICVALVAGAGAQAKKAAPKATVHDVTINAEGVYTGTMELAVDGGKVTGNMHLTKPTEIVGKVSGTSKAGVMALEFPYLMKERNCEGTVKMELKVPAKPGPTSGTMEARGCGRDAASPLQGTVELVPAKAQKK
jgi:hypothetical protein